MFRDARYRGRSRIVIDMSRQGLVSYTGIPSDQIIGGQLTWSWGVRPSSARIFMVQEARLPKHAGNLTFEFDGTSVTWPKAAIAPSTLRLFQGREAFIQSVQIYDRRWKWRYPRISGEYNVYGCDGKVIESTRKPLTSLFNLLFDALGESNESIIDMPPGVYPHVKWEDARAADELELLAERFGGVIVPKLDDTFAVERIGSGADLPDDGAQINPRLEVERSVLPEKVQVVMGRTRIQKWLLLRAVGLDIDGSIKLIDDLSYKPAGGWHTQWYNDFADVNIAHRHLAFATVWRWYQVVPQDIASVPVSIENSGQYELLPHTAESPEDHEGLRRCAPPQVRGVFWPQSLHHFNTGDNAIYAGPFTILPEHSLVEFRHPVVKTAASGPEPAELELNTAFYLKHPDGRYLRETVSADVSESIEATEPRVEKHYWLGHIDVIDPLYGQGGDNLGEQRGIAQTIADQVAATYTGERGCMFAREGFHRIELSGKIPQVMLYKFNHGAFTRASCNTEFDIYSPGHADRRFRQQATQLADKLLHV